MGATNSNQQNKVYVNIVNGKFAIRAKDNTPNAVERTNKNGKKVWEVLYDTLDNMRLTKIEKITNNEYGDNWEVTLQEADEVMVLNLPYSGRTTNGLFHKLPNVKLDMPITLKVYRIEDDNKAGVFKTHLTVWQGGNKIASAFTKENPNGLPQLEQITVKGKLVWDDTKQMAYLEKLLNEIFIPKLRKLNEAPKANFQPTAQNENETHPIGEDDDLPF